MTVSIAGRVLGERDITVFPLAHGTYVPGIVEAKCRADLMFPVCRFIKSALSIQSVHSMGRATALGVDRQTGEPQNCLRGYGLLPKASVYMKYVCGIRRDFEFRRTQKFERE